MEQREQENRLEERGLGDILSETFLIYGRHFRKLVIMSALAQAPVTALILVPIAGWWFTVLVSAISGVALMMVHGAVISAVGQHYALGRVSVGGCYERVAWRAVSLAVVALPMAALTAALFLLVEPLAQAAQTSETAGSPESPSPLLLLALLAVLVAIVAFSIYMTTVVAAIVVQGYRSMRAVAMGVRLARGSELRIFGHLMVYWLVAFGLYVALILPFALADGFIAAPAEGGAAAFSVPLALGGLTVGVLVPPVVSIATTLLYCDLRVRKEGYDVSWLSREMGVAPA